jgi:hypothetical protein
MEKVNQSNIASYVDALGHDFNFLQKQVFKHHANMVDHVKRKTNTVKWLHK